MAITREQIIDICKNYEDPELGIDVWSLGLIYEINIESEQVVHLKITFTSPMCPFGPEMVEDLTSLIKYKGATEVNIDVVFDPPWKPPEELRDMLGL